MEDSAPYVARGLLQILQPKDSQFLDADGRKLSTDRLLKGKSDPTACPQVRGFRFGRPFQADAHVSLIDLVGDSCRARLRTNPRSRDGGQPAPQLKGRYSTASIAFLASLTRRCPPSSRSSTSTRSCGRKAASTPSCSLSRPPMTRTRVPARARAAARDRDWHGPAHLRRASDESARGGAMSKGEQAQALGQSLQKSFATRWAPVGGTFVLRKPWRQSK